MTQDPAVPASALAPIALAPIALAGIGKIACDQHVPAIAATGQFRVAATLSRTGSLPGVPAYTAFAALRAAHPEVEAIALCTPPQVRLSLARAALHAGLDVLLEKPPAATTSEIRLIEDCARTNGRVLFASWHSRFAAGVPAARSWLAGQKLRAVQVTWREDVRQWHPGQDWIWQPGGMGVFDPGINALSILTEILPDPLILCAADLEVPENRQMPIAARLQMQTLSGAPATADFDFREDRSQIWTIRVETDGGTLLLEDGGARLSVDGRPLAPDPAQGSEYEALYRHFAGLRAAGRSDVDTAPLALVADAFLLGRRQSAAPFHD